MQSCLCFFKDWRTPDADQRTPQRPHPQAPNASCSRALQQRHGNQNLERSAASSHGEPVDKAAENAENEWLTWIYLTNMALAADLDDLANGGRSQPRNEDAIR